jgi:hypothetical protein
MLKASQQLQPIHYASSISEDRAQPAGLLKPLTSYYKFDAPPRQKESPFFATKVTTAGNRTSGDIVHWAIALCNCP